MPESIYDLTNGPLPKDTLMPSRRHAIGLGLSTLFTGLVGPARAQTFQRGPTQYIAALGDKTATSGDDAATWGFWAVDPGPRGVLIRHFGDLMANGGTAPDGWQFDPSAWWLEEHGLMMEAPSFPLPAGNYVVTGGREVTSVLTVQAPDAQGNQVWSLADDDSIYDVTHLRCRAAVYTAAEGATCNPQDTNLNVFPLTPEVAMPAVTGCSKQDYQVLIVIGMMVDG